MMQIGQGKLQVFHLFIALLYYVPEHFIYLATQPVEDIAGINQCLFEFKARGKHKKYKILLYICYDHFLRNQYL